MRRFTLVVFVLVVMAAAPIAVLGQSDPWVGTWKLNLAKSKYDPANLAPKSQTTKIEAAPGGYKVVTDGADNAGKPTHTEITYKFDGKEYEVKGATEANTTRIYTKVNATTYQFVNKVGGKVTTTTRVVMAADGKSRTNTATGTNAQGQKVNNVAVYEKQ